MKDLQTEIYYLTSDATAISKALEKGDFVFARKLIEAMRESVDNLATHTEELAGQGRFTVIEVN